ncbi:MAG: DUF4349 domain-containing protein [Coriobacteriales bacterium]|nr:DUF4349 domain-containing protein [Coriobacteriales bacterium]
MTGRMRIVVVVGVAFAVLAAAVIGYWAASMSTADINVGMTSKSPTIAPEMAPPSGTTEFSGDSAQRGATADSAGAPAESTSQGVPKAVIRTAAIEVRVEDVEKSLVVVRRAVTAAKGEIQSLTYYAGDEGPVQPLAGGAAPSGPKSATAVIRVPTDQLAAVSAKMAGLGTVVTQSANEEDVTQETIDIAARLKNLRAEEARLRSFFDRARNVREMLSIEQELSRVRGEIEAMQAQQDYLERQTSMATLTVTLTEPGAIVSPSGGSWGFGEAITDGIRAAARLIQVAITVLIALLPLIAIALVVWALLRLRARRRAARESEPPPAE